MRRIAIIKSREFYTGDYDDYASQKIIDSITDWDEVSDEDFACLQAMAGRLNFSILERPADTGAFIAKTVKEYKDYVKAEEKRVAEEKRLREEAALERKMKKELKDKTSKEKMLKKLIDELGPDAVKSLTANS